MTCDNDDSERESDHPSTHVDSDRDQVNRGRRAAIKTLSGLSVGAGIATFLSGDDSLLSARDEVSIVYGYGRTDPSDPATLKPLTKQVPVEWYTELAAALQRHRQLPWQRLNGLVGSFVIPGDYTDPAASLAMQGTAQDLRGEVTGLLPDINTQIDILDDLPPRPAETELGAPKTVANFHDPAVPGGVFCKGGGVYGSLAPAVYDSKTGRPLFATANHLYGGSGAAHQGAPLSLVRNGQRAPIGSVRRGYANEDIILVEPSNEYHPQSEISDTVPGTVAGQFTKLGLADLKARDEQLEKRGAISGTSTGKIKGIDGITVYGGNIPKTGQLLWGDETITTDGDSGSVNFHPDPADSGRLLIGGLNNARTWWTGADFTWGTAAYHIRTRHGYTF